ncbi:MAG TPA: sigma-54 dependent transcriptional regulator [Spirochaetia bacterium]|nr:sigma-54 dependent transcriptional regulator [Spirochaetia bacterium]
MARILVVDDEDSVRQFLQEVLEDAGYAVVLASGGLAALDECAEVQFDAVLMDNRMPDLEGLKALEELRGRKLEVPVILMTAYGTTHTAINAMQLGAFDYITKPFNLEELLGILEKAVRRKNLAKGESPLANGGAAGELPVEELMGSSPVMQGVYKHIGRVADSSATVLLLGESGTGKGLVARTIHRHSGRKDRPFVKINCATIPENLIESELFGHERGAFTGAARQKLGKFEVAHQGTVFLDEVGELSPAMQVKLLRVLQEREFERVGGNESIHVDVRIIAATNRDLELCVREGTFREDLYFRLNVITLKLPALRERADDIRELAEHFLVKYSREFGKKITSFAPAAMEMLLNFDWPGNVRELENACERAVVMAAGPVILPEDLPLSLSTLILPDTSAIGAGRSLKEIVADVERQVILKVLRENNWHRGAAAQALGLNRRSLYAKMKEYGLI